MGTEPAKEVKQKLENAGWRFLRKKYTTDGTLMFLWDHPNHQYGARGSFTTTQALEHQKKVEQFGSCKCIPREFNLHE